MTPQLRAVIRTQREVLECARLWRQVCDTSSPLLEGRVDALRWSVEAYENALIEHDVAEGYSVEEAQAHLDPYRQYWRSP